MRYNKNMEGNRGMPLENRQSTFVCQKGRYSEVAVRVTTVSVGTYSWECVGCPAAGGTVGWSNAFAVAFHLVRHRDVYKDKVPDNVLDYIGKAVAYQEGLV